jgi:hypothetical protein
LATFTNAFASGGGLRVYGCNIQDPIPAIGSVRNYYKSIAWGVIDYIRRLLATMNSANGDWQSLRKGSMPTKQFTIDMNAEYEREQQDITEGGHYTPESSLDAWQRVRYPNDPIFFPATDGVPIGSIPSVLTRSYQQIVGLIARRALASYVYYAAAVLAPSSQAIQVFGAAPGTSGEFEPGPAYDFNLMACRPTWGGHWFHVFFGAKIGDPTTNHPRAYLLFDANFVNKISAASTQ